MICKQCGIEIHRPQFCSRNCSGKYRRIHVYGDKFTNKWRSSCPRKFLSSSLNKGRGREALSIDYMMSLYENQRGFCAISGREMTYIAGKGRVETNMSIDRIDSSVGYIVGNIQLACRQANIMKMELSMEDLTSWCDDILNTQRKK